MDIFGLFGAGIILLLAYAYMDEAVIRHQDAKHYHYSKLRHKRTREAIEFAIISTALIIVGVMVLKTALGW